MNTARSLSSLTTDQGPSALTRLLAARRTLVMGILNVTPDSFSDGGLFFDPAIAIAHATRMVQEGADIIDIGAESTRPYGNAVAISVEEECARLQPILPPVIALGKPVSIDSMKAKVVAWAIEQGAQIANDIWGLQHDPDMARVVAEYRVPVIVMHNRIKADPGIDIIADMMAFFERSLEIADRAGVARDMILLDPGIGFGKTPEQSIQAIARFEDFKRFGLPLLMALSRKRFISHIVPSEPMQRLGGSIAGNLLAVQKGAAILRVHDVAETVQALRVSEAIGAAQ